MNYFVNENIFTLNSGTEFSAAKRVHLFRKNGVDAKIVTRNYNTQLSADLKRVGLVQSEVINMYDYFQELMDAEDRSVDLRYSDAINRRRYHIEGVDSNESLVKHDGRTIAKVKIAPATVGLIGSIDYFNDMNVVVATDHWDRRGFKSSTQYYHQNGEKGAQVFFDLKGNAKLEITHMNINNQLFPTMWKLLSYKGKAWRFNTEMELFDFFLSELSATGDAVFFNDRPSLINSVAGIPNAAGKWHVLHNVHTDNTRQSGASRGVVLYLKELFTSKINSFDGIIVSTELEKNEIEKFYKFRNVLVMPDTFADAEVEYKGVQTRDKNKIVHLGRLASERKPVDVIEIFALAKKEQPDLKLEFFGYASPATIQQEMQKIIDERGLTDSVSFKGYQSEEVLAKELDNAAALISTADQEAFGMHLLEGLNHGVPTFAYQVKYGPITLIEDKKNGRLFPYAGMKQMAKGLVEMLSNEEKWSQMSENAYESAKVYSQENVWRSWQEAKQIASNLYL